MAFTKEELNEFDYLFSPDSPYNKGRKKELFYEDLTPEQLDLMKRTEERTLKLLDKYRIK